MTAVEQLVQELKKLGVLKIDDLHWTEQDDVNNAIQQAKEMEKEKIMNAVLYGFRQDSDGDDWQGDNYNAEKYYNETFKSE